MSIRFKTVEYCWWEPRSANDGSLTQVCVDQVTPIRDWSAIPGQIIAPNWAVGSVEPLPISINIVFPELDKVYGDGNYRFKIKKTINGVDFVNITSPNLVGDTFSAFNLAQATITVNFQNMNNLSVGNHLINLEIEAFVVSNNVETFKESSTIQNVIVPISINVLAGSGFNTDKDVYSISFNKADNTISGDLPIHVYSTEAVTYNSSNNFIVLQQSAGSSERLLNFEVNTNLQALAVGNYSATVTITKGTQSKVVTVNVQVLNDTTQFYITPTNYLFSMQKNLSEVKTFTSVLSNPNNLTINVDVKPSFIESVVITANSVTFVTKSSSDLALGNYSGDIVLKAGSVTKSISVKINLLEGLTHDFIDAPYYFALDKNKVLVNKTNSLATYVQMELVMYFKGYGKESQENQKYTFPFFQGSAEIYPGEEIQDFFMKCYDLNFDSETEYSYNLATVELTFKEMNDFDEIINVYSLGTKLFAPGKKPKCYPIFTDHKIRSTYNNSIIDLNVDVLSTKEELTKIYEQYQEAQPHISQQAAVYRYSLQRQKFNPVLKTNLIAGVKMQFIPLPEPQDIVHVKWETQNLVFDWFSAVRKFKQSTEFEVVSGESGRYMEEKYDSNYSKPLTLNSGWLLQEEIELVDDLLKSRICFIKLDDVVYKAFPIGKKNELNDSENNKFCMDLEFKILIEK